MPGSQRTTAVTPQPWSSTHPGVLLVAECMTKQVDAPVGEELLPRPPVAQRGSRVRGRTFKTELQPFDWPGLVYASVSLYVTQEALIKCPWATNPSLLLFKHPDYQTLPSLLSLHTIPHLEQGPCSKPLYPGARDTF